MIFIKYCTNTNLFPLQSVQSPHSARVQLDCICDVSEHLLEGMGRLLVEKYPDRLSGFDSTTDDRDEFGFDVILGLTLQLILQREKRGEGAGCASPASHCPVWIDILGVLHAPVGFV